MTSTSKKQVANPSSNQLKAAAKAQKNAFLNESMSASQALICCVRMERQPEFTQLFKAAGVPERNASGARIKNALLQRVMDLLPYVETDGGRVYTSLTPKRDNALLVPENITTAHNVAGCNYELIHGSFKNALYIGKQVKVYEKQEITDPQGHPQNICVKDDAGNKIYHTEQKKYYLCESGYRYKGIEIYNAFAKLIGIPAMIDDAAMEAEMKKQAKAVASAARAAAKLQEIEAQAKATAAKMEKAAAKAKETAEKAATAANLTSEEAAKIATAAKLADDAQATEKAITNDKPKQRKRTNTRTKASKQVTTY